LLLGDIFCCSDTQYNTNQTAVSIVHMPVNDYLVPLVTYTLTDAVVCLDTMLICCCLLNIIIVIIIEFLEFFSWSLLCCTLVSVLVLGIGIARGQYYWVLDIGCLSWYRSNPIFYPTNRTIPSIRHRRDYMLYILLQLEVGFERYRYWGIGNWTIFACIG